MASGQPACSSLKGGHTLETAASIRCRFKEDDHSVKPIDLLIRQKLKDECALLTVDEADLGVFEESGGVEEAAIGTDEDVGDALLA